MKYLLSVLLLMLSGAFLLADKAPLYPISDIPDELMKNSNAVVREDITKYEIVNKAKGKKYSKTVITIINKKADHFAEVRVGYDKLSKVVSINGRIIDKLGKVIKVLKNKDIDDYSAYDGFSIYTDNRVKHFDLRYPDYPYTIEYEIEEEDDGLFVTPGWVPFPSFNVSSQSSSLEIVAPDGYLIRYKELNMDPLARERTEGGKKSISWEFGSYPAIERESRMPFLRDILPTVITAPSEFEMEGYAGSMSDWIGFGKWEDQLNAGRDGLPSEFADKVRTIVKDVESRTEKVKLLYEYLQHNTRYVSIQLGIGGWQTFPATDVVENGYGDCKALSNFMKAMLKVADIESFYTLVRAGSDAPDILKEFPSNQFNHMILCVPNYQDTLWLECTSQDNPFGFQGSFTGDRDVLVINESGGNIVHTRKYQSEANRQIQSANVVINEQGSASVNLSVTNTGRQYENLSHLLDIGETEQKKWLYRNLDLPGFELANFEFSQKKQPIPELYGDFEMTVNRFASVSGKRIFFQPNVFNKSGSVRIPQKERKYDFVLDYPFIDTDTVQFHIPEGYHLEYLPETTVIESPYGRYESRVIAEEGKVTYVRTRSSEKGTFPAEDYLKYVEFRNEIAEADKTKLVLVKST